MPFSGEANPDREWPSRDCSAGCDPVRLVGRDERRPNIPEGAEVDPRLVMEVRSELEGALLGPPLLSRWRRGWVLLRRLRNGVL